MRDIFIIGSKGIPAKYGGFETFVHKLVENQTNRDIHYHVACIGENNSEFNWMGARCFKIKIPNLGSAKAVLYDLLSLSNCLKYIERNRIKDAVIYILACRIGPFMLLYKNKIEKKGIKIFVNPDGNEWRRKKWNYFVQKYWKCSERLMVKNVDLLVCDSRVIESYIKDEYKIYSPNTAYISYGADVKSSIESDNEKLDKWCLRNELRRNEYYLMVGRFVPENNYELIIKEYLKTSTKKPLVIITNYKNSKYFFRLTKNTGFRSDKRIKFVGTVYDQGLIKKIRENAYAYIHGHEVGGTNPSLLESLASTRLNIVLNVTFNKEVCNDSVIYFSKSVGSFSNIIKEAENLSKYQIDYYEKSAKKRINECYYWTGIINKYEKLFLN